ncbi:hypothetical protein QUF90_16120 [Desulfococcaceae bacterium HSG9]|nr:hypothetical protein [Desulfococcaceae bacterium HSG9]
MPYKSVIKNKNDQYDRDMCYGAINLIRRQITVKYKDDFKLTVANLSKHIDKTKYKVTHEIKIPVLELLTYEKLVDFGVNLLKWDTYEEVSEQISILLKKQEAAE